MSPRIMPAADDPIGRGAERPLSITVDGRQVDGVEGQTVAGVLLGAGIDSWRTSSRERRPRGVFCGIGVCFDCVVTVNGERDVRACMRRAEDGDVLDCQVEGRPEADA